MSALLESLLDPRRRADAVRNDGTLWLPLAVPPHEILGAAEIGARMLESGDLFITTPRRILDRPISISKLRELLNYDPESGLLTWKVRPAQRVKVGDRAGYVGSQGYRCISILHVTRMEHRVAWALGHGAIPDDTLRIDHINGEKTDNRLCNLRLVSDRVNRENQRMHRPRNKVGLLGVSKRQNGSFSARIQVRGRMLYLGTFGTAEEAHTCYVNAKRVMHEGNTL